MSIEWENEKKSDYTKSTESEGVSIIFVDKINKEQNYKDAQ